MSGNGVLAKKEESDSLVGIGLNGASHLEEIPSPSLDAVPKAKLADIEEQGDIDNSGKDPENVTVEVENVAVEDENGGDEEPDAEDDDEEDGEDEEEEDEDEEDEDSDDLDAERPRKKKRRKRVGHQFLDIEADVDEDEDEEEEEGEEGFVATDDFIVPRRETREGILPGIGDDAGDESDTGGDASHRRLDRRRMAQRDKEAAELAASFHDRYGKARYDIDGADDWAPKALLMPGVMDPSIWGVRCRVGRERELVLSLSRKAAALALSDNATPLQIISAFHRDSIKGYLYVEARSESHVRAAINGLIGIYANGPNGIFLVDIEEMPDLLKTKQKKVEVLPGGWVRFKRAKYAGDLAQIIDLSENGEDILLKFIPRIDLTPKDDPALAGPDGRKRKKGAFGGSLSFRPPQRLFNPEEIAKVYGKNEVSKRPGGTLYFKNEIYKDGFCEKDVKMSALIIEDVQPTIDELTRFTGDSNSLGRNGEGGGGLDLSTMADAARRTAKSILQPGDHVEVFEGDQRGMYGTVDSISNDVVIITPHASLDLEGTKVEVQARSVRKRFQAGDHVKVMNGTNTDETGLIVKVKDDVVTFLSDLSLQEVTVFSRDVREAAEVGSGINVIGQYELHDLVQLDPQTTGVIFKVERDTFRILDQSGALRTLKPSQIGIKIKTRNALATDQEGYDIKVGDMMKESIGAREVRRGRVLHIYRSMYAFLHNRDYVENGGVFVAQARALASTAPKAMKPKVGMGLNPDRFGIPGAAPQAQESVGSRPDGRIHRRVLVTRGAYKGNAGVIKDVTGVNARVELHTNSKVINVPVDALKEQKSDGSLVILQERPGSFGRPSGGRPMGGDSRSDWGGASVNASGANGSSLGSRTPFPSYGGRTPAPGWSGGRTPAPVWSGGRTPAPTTASSNEWDSSSRTPSYGGSEASWAAGSRTPAHAGPTPSEDGWGASSQTPRRPPQSSFDPWSASSRTPFHPSATADTNDGGRTPDPRAGGRTPAYGGRSAYVGRPVASDAWAPTPAAHSAPTPGPGNDDWDAPTPAANKQNNDYSSGFQAKTPYEAQTPSYEAPTPAAGAPTPAQFDNHYGSAATPGFAGAPTPGAYGQTPGNYGRTPAAYGQTAGAYVGAATAAAQPLEYRDGNTSHSSVPSNWAHKDARVQFLTSEFQKGRFNEQYGVVIGGSASQPTIALDSNGEQVSSVPLESLQPVQPSKAGDRVILLSGPKAGQRATCQSRDGAEWMVQLSTGGSLVTSEHQLALSA